MHNRVKLKLWLELKLKLKLKLSLEAASASACAAQSLLLPSSILMQLCKVQVQRWPQGVFSHFVNFPLFATSGPLTRWHALTPASLAASFAAAGNCLRFVLLSFEIIIKIGL